MSSMLNRCHSLAFRSSLRSLALLQPTQNPATSGSRHGLGQARFFSPEERGIKTTHKVLEWRQVIFYKQCGYLVVENFWTDEEIRAIRVALHKLQLEGKLANVATTGDGKTHTSEARNLQLCPLSPEASIFRSLPFTTKVSIAAAQLLLDKRVVGADDVLCYLSQTFWKPAKHGLGTSWHQDNAYFDVADAQSGMGMWTAVHDATKENGTIEIIPDIYSKSVLKHERDGDSDHHITCRKEIDESKAVPIELKAGGVLFFNLNTPHCTRANMTSKPRAAVAYHFVTAPQWVDRAFPLPEKAEWITPIVSGFGCSLGVVEYGERADNFERDVQDCLREEAEVMKRVP